MREWMNDRTGSNCQLIKLYSLCIAYRTIREDRSLVPGKGGLLASKNS